jgi:hypothetical protein
MSAIFPTKPPKGTLHFIPKTADFISYRIGDNLIISAWMPNEFHHIEANIEKSNDEFFESYCDGCERNCSSFLDQYADEDGDVNWDDVPGGHCMVYDEGYHGQDCPLGHEEDDEELVDFPVSNMVFEIHLSHLGKMNRFSRQSDSAYLCAGKLTEGNEILCTDTLRASNVFGSDEFSENICWGYNSVPHNLSEIIRMYTTTSTNNDLLPVRCFYDNCKEILSLIRLDEFGPVEDGDTYLCSDKSALLLLDASEHVSAFFQMLSAGFTSLPKAPHIMILPLSEKAITVGTHSISGYCTDLDAVGKSWFVSSDGEILGQMDGL